MSFKLSAGVYPQEYVKGSGPYNATSMTIGASVFGSKKGPIGPHLVTGGYEEFVKLYGNGDMQWSQAHLALKPALKEMGIFYGNRVVNEAKYAGLSFYYDTLNDRFFSKPFVDGKEKNYENAINSSKVLSISSYLSAGDTIKVSLAKSSGNIEVSQVYDQTSNNTLNELAKKLQEALDANFEGGSAEVVKTWNLSDRKTSLILDFGNEVFQVGNKVKFKISASNPTLEGGTIEETFDGSTIASAGAFLNKIIQDINALSGFKAVEVPADNPQILVNLINAGPGNIEVTSLSFEPTSRNPYVISYTQGHGVYDDRSIVIIPSENIESLDISGEVQGSGVTVQIEENAKVMDIYAENPGAWASNSKEGLGIKIKDLDTGIAQRLKLTFSDALVAGNEFNCLISSGDKSFPIGPIAYNTSNQVTLYLIANAINTCLQKNFSWDSSLSSSETGANIIDSRNILIVMPNAKDSIEISDVEITGSNSTMVTVREVIPNTPSKETFTLEVYNRESLANPIESWETSLKQQLDVSGNQMYLPDRINKGAYESANIRVALYTSDFSKLRALDNIAWLGGGDDGYLPTNAQIVAGWNEFADPEKITVRLLINAGYANSTVHQAMASIAKKRRDCVALLDMPSDSQSTAAAMNYRQYEMNVNTSYAAIYSPDVLVFDENSGTDVYIAPSGYAAAQICYTERVRAIYWAPAGLNRGICDGAKGVRVIYGEGDRDLLEPLQINPIRDMGTSGIAIFGEYTTQTASDPFRDLHVRLMCNNIEIAMTDTLAYQLFEPNDEFVRSTMAMDADSYLQPIKNGRGIRDYRIVSDITKEKAADVDAGCGVLNLYIKPTSSLKFIRLNSYILGSGINFDEVIESGI